MVYNFHMDKKPLLKLICREAVIVWDDLCVLHPRLAQFPMPDIYLNNRFTRTAGVCYQEENYIELASKFFKSKKNFEYMIDVILPHELIHQADYNLFGDSEKSCGHGKNWCKLMLEYGLKPDPFHRMKIVK